MVPSSGANKWRQTPSQRTPCVSVLFSVCESRFVTGSCVCVCVSPPTALTAEQYQQHQEQLALMQKQQLEQIQLQQQANSTATTNSTKVGGAVGRFWSSR